MSVDARRTQLGPYRLIAEIGRGGMGVVYRGVHVETRLQVAVKTVHAATPAVLAMMRREIRALTRLSHPGVVRIIDEGVDGAVPWYAMELLQGRTLSEFRDATGSTATGSALRASQAETRGDSETVLSGPMRTDDPVSADTPDGLATAPIERRPPNPWLFEGLSVIRRLCPTLAFLHGHGIVHRDLKPANILIRPDGRPVLTDFGLVTQMWGEGGRPMVDAAEHGYGSPPYMAPEQINGDAGDPRIDFYALGCILYELVSGQPPFDGPTVRDVMAGHLHRAPLPLSAFVDEVPAGLETLITRLLEKHPRDRLGYADDVAAALDALGVRAGAATDDPPSDAYLYRPRMIGRKAVRTRVAVPVLGAVQGTGGVSLVAAESGAGKTTLAASVGDLARGVGLQVVTATCGATAREADSAVNAFRAAPLQAFRPLLQAVADRCVGEGEAFTRELLGARGRVLGAYEPAIEQLASQVGLPPLADIPADAALDRLVATFTGMLSRYLARQPLLLIFEDLQWADGLSMRVLDALARGFCRTRPLAIIATYRTDEVTEGITALGIVPDVNTITLPPLGDDEIGEIIGEMLAMHEVPGPLTRLLARCSGGNPLFVREYLRAAVEERRLYRHNGAWTFTADLLNDDPSDSTSLPESLRGLVSRRISTVSAPAASLLAAASILGASCDVSLLQETGELAEIAGLDALGELLERSFLEDRGGGRLAFTHDKIREFVDAELPDEDRRRLHRAAGAALERRWAGSPELPLYFGELAHHFQGAGDAAKAMDYFGRAGEQALATSAYEDAITYLHRALALDAGGAAPEEARRRARWHLTLGEAFRCLDDFGRSREHLTQALALFGWPVPSGKVRMMTGTLGQIALQIATRYGLAPTALRPGQAATVDDATRSCVSLLQVSRVCGDPMLPLYATIRGLNLAERGASAAQRASGFGIWRILLAALGMPGLAEKYDVHVARELEATTDAAGRAYALVFSSVHYLLIGSWQQCIDAGVEARTLAADAGMRRIWEEAQVCVAAAYAYRGEARRALTEYQAILVNGRPGVERVKIWAHTGIAIVSTQLGELGPAQAAIDEGLALSHDKLEPGDFVMFLGAAAYVALYRSDHERARECADRATVLIDKTPGFLTETTSAIQVLMAVYVELYRANPTAALRAVAERTCKKAMAVGKRVPYLKAQALYWTGECALIKGAPAEARTWWERAVKSAGPKDMPAEIGRSHLALARLQGPDAAHHDQAAHAIFERLGRPLPSMPPTASARR
jgi:serine/threonine protein kinase/tetratricopeptide (TPR) repeat protein